MKSLPTLCCLALAINIFSQPSSCFDGYLNGLEVDIDCGGECNSCEDGLSEGIFERDSLNFQFPFAIWLPPGYESENKFRKFPLIVFLHGNGELRGTDPENPRTTTYEIQNYGPMRYANKSWWNYPFIIVNPIRNQSIASELENFINEVSSVYNIDNDRIYLTGLSGGSFAIASYIVNYPDKIASMASIAGYFPRIAPSIRKNLKGVPIWYFHNKGDGTVRFSHSTIRDIGNMNLLCEPSPDPYINFSIFKNGGHNSWEKVYDPYKNQNDNSLYESQYELADLTNLTDGSSDAYDYHQNQKVFGLPNDIETIYDWFLKYENIPNSCRNEVQDADETGVDCGGSCKPCTATYECHNGILDDGEVAIDCGGDCPTCEREILWRNMTWNNSSGPIETDNTTILENYSGGFTTNSLYIDEDVTFTVSGTLEVKEELENNGTLIVPSGASLITYEGVDVSSNIIFQKNTRFSNRQYSFVGSPVTQDASNTAFSLGNYVYTYDETLSSDPNDLSRWVLSNGTDELLPGIGYTQADQELIELIGRPNSGSITIDASYENDGWHLISNPYPAALNIDKFIDGNPNITGSIYLWDDNGSSSQRGSSNDYIVANKMGATDLNGNDNSSRWNGYIGSFQGFFVKLNGAPGEIFFTEEMRVPNNNSEDNFFRKSDNSRLVISLKQNEMTLRTMLGFTNAASDDRIITGYDAAIFDVNAKNSFYSIKEDQYLAIQGLSHSANQISLGMSLSESGRAKLTFNTKNLNEHFYLHDGLTKQSFPLTNDLEYAFEARPGILDERFTLIKADNILGTEESDISFYTYKKILYLKTKANDIVNLQIVDLNGKLQKEIKVSGSSKIDLNHFPSGIYIIKVGLNKSKVLLQ